MGISYIFLASNRIHPTNTSRCINKVVMMSIECLPSINIIGDALPLLIDPPQFNPDNPSASDEHKPWMGGRFLVPLSSWQGVHFLRNLSIISNLFSGDKGDSRIHILPIHAPPQRTFTDNETNFRTDHPPSGCFPTDMGGLVRWKMEKQRFDWSTGKG